MALLVAEEGFRAHRARERIAPQDVLEPDAPRRHRLGSDPLLDGLVAIHVVDASVPDIAGPERLDLDEAVVHEEAAGQAPDRRGAPVELGTAGGGNRAEAQGDQEQTADRARATATR